MKSAKSRFVLIATLLAVAAGSACAECSNETLLGRYAFTVTGQIITPGVIAGPVSGVALTEFDGAGGLTQVDHVLHNGIAPIEAWRPGGGSYSINANCTGWMTITPHPTNPADASPQLKLYIVVTENGHKIQTVVSGSPVAPGFSASIISTGVRVQSEDN